MISSLIAAARQPRAAVLPIANLKQAGDGLCWAACLIPIIAFCTDRVLSQEELCEAAAKRPHEGATTDEMADALMRTAGIRTRPTKPISPEVTFQHLANRSPIILELDVGDRFAAHCATLRGLVHAGTWQAVVNEPNLRSGTSVFVPFAQLHAAWRHGLIVNPAGSP